MGSYTAANTYPLKILQNTDLMRKLNEGRIPPYHVQLYVTNHCNLHCSFCSCRNKNTDELSLDRVKTLTNELVQLGCRAVTISGGGEPLCHPDINEIIAALSQHVEVGLATNGILLPRLTQNTLRWCRISLSDERCLDESTISQAVKRIHTDWALSYVVTDHPNLANIAKCVMFANHGFTHVRLVPNLVGGATPFAQIKKYLASQNIDDSRVIYQTRTPKPGAKTCFLSCLKPVIGADGFIYPCCSVQFAHDPPDLNMPSNMRMGRSLEGLTPFDGSRCAVCYYGEYNELLGKILNKSNHGLFV